MSDTKTYLSIFKVKLPKKNEKGPDYRISMKIGDEFKNVGAGWIKDGQKGKFISAHLEGRFEYVPREDPTATHTDPKPDTDYGPPPMNEDNVPF